MQPVAPPPPQIPDGAPINLEQAKRVLAGAEAEAKKNKSNMVIAVLDSGGHLVMLERMDGTQLGSIEAAKDKAYSAVLRRRSFPLRELLAHAALQLGLPKRALARLPPVAAIGLNTLNRDVRRDPPLAGLIGGPCPLLLGGVLQGGTASEKHS